jgi:hypothetical protein
LGHTGNAQGDYFFLSLVAGRRLSRHQWTVFPVTKAAIARVEQVAAEENQPWVQSSGLLFEWRPDHPIDEDDDLDYVYDPEQDDDQYDEDLRELDSITEDEINENKTVDPSIDGTQPNIAPAPTVVLHGSVLSTLSEEEPASIGDDDSATMYTMEETAEMDPAPEPPETPSPPRYNLRPVRDRSYAHRPSA